MRTPTWRVAALLFGSGFCALVYQVGWLRDFRLIFGASTAASAAVLAIFIGGLGTGSLWLGPRADSHPRPILFYAQLESIIAVSAAASPLLLALAREAYLAAGGSMRLGLGLSTLVRLALSVVVLAVPTTAMGGTLPAAARGVTRTDDVRRRDVGVLYALNTLGAVAGSVVATFSLLEVLGTRRTIWIAAAINLLVAISARRLDQSTHAAATASELDPPALPVPPAHPAPPALPAHSAPVPFVLLASAIVGFAFFLMELVWYRLLAPLLGGSVFTFGLVLAVALGGIGLGGLLYTLTDDKRTVSLASFSISCLLEAAAVAATFALGDRIATLTMVLLPMRAAGFAATIAGWTLVTFLVVLPPALIAGYQFPLLIALLGRGRERIGREVGMAYAANTLGGIAGSLAGGFGLIPWLSAPGTWRLAAVLLLILGIAAAWLARRDAVRALDWRRWVMLVPSLAAAAAIAIMLSADGPTPVWRHGGIGAGRVPSRALTSPNELTAWQRLVRAGVVWEGDGVESSVALVMAPAGYAFIVNGKSDGSARADAGTQVMLGLIGGLSHPQPRRALVVGLGTGQTAGWLAGVPTIERVDVVELEPLVLDVARACDATNLRAMLNPKLQVIVGDAREVLLTGRDRYDVIVSEPSNPFRAGIASLFTLEFYRAASDRLTDDGVFAQWVQGYEIDAPTLRTIYVTLGAAFAQIDTWQTGRGDLVLVASKQPRRYSARALAGRLAGEPFRTAVPRVWGGLEINSFLAHYVAADGLARALRLLPGVDVNTDDRNSVEFGLARSVGRPGATRIIAESRELARRLNAARPPLSDEDGVSWPAVDTARVSYQAADGEFDEMPSEAPTAERARHEALIRYFRWQDPAGAQAAWTGQSDPPRDLFELTMVGGFYAESGSDLARPFLDQLRVYQPAEADTLLALLRLRQNRTGEAAEALVAALVRMRVDPWPVMAAAQNAVDLADTIAAREPGQARRLFEALSQPFVVRAVDTARLLAAAGLSRRIDFPALCRQPIGALEPFVPWNARLLSLRLECYQAAGDARVAIARRDLQRFVSREPVALDVYESQH